MKTTNNYENMTMADIRTLLDEKISDYNLATDAVVRVNLAVEHNALVQKYNDMSLHTAYGECLQAEQPIVALAKAYYYDTISVKDAVHNEMVDGKQKSSVTRSVKEGVKKLNLVKFLEWVEEGNISITANKDWRTPMGKARAVVEDQWKKFFASGKDTHSMSIGKTKKALQEMFDALVFIPSETGKNAIIANGDVAKWVLAFATDRKDSKLDGVITISGTILSRQTWATLQMDILHKVVENKTYDIVYGSEVEDAEAAAKAVAEPEAEADAE